MQNLVVLSVTLLITYYFPAPKPDVTLRHLKTTFLHGRQFSILNHSPVPVPKTAIHKYSRAIPPHHNVRLARHTLNVQPVPVSMTPQPPPHKHLRLSGTAMYVLHTSTPLFRSQWVWHNYSDESFSTTPASAGSQFTELSSAGSSHFADSCSLRVSEPLTTWQA